VTPVARCDWLEENNDNANNTEIEIQATVLFVDMLFSLRLRSGTSGNQIT